MSRQQTRQKAPRVRETTANRHSAPARGLPSRDSAAKPQSALGNHALLSRTSGVLQPKLVIGPSNDAYEQEANRVADRVMRMSPESLEVERPTFIPGNRALQRKCACGGTPGPAGECEECRKKHIQRKINRYNPGSDRDSLAPAIVHEVLRSPGQPLDATARAFMEARFGHQFDKVRVHTDAKAADSARAVNALAYTVGSNMVFGAAQYAPSTKAGGKLLAHELTHVMQQQSDNRNGALTFSHPATSSNIQRANSPGAVIQRQSNGGGTGANRGKAEGISITLPETTIVATQPTSFRTAIGRTSYYIDRASDFANRNPGDLPPDYYFLYGNKYLNRFKTFLRPTLSAYGKAWLDCTLIALQTAIEDKLDTNPWAFAELERDNDKFQEFAFDTHSQVYTSCGVCDLSIIDQTQIALTPDVFDLLTLGGVRQIIDTFLECQVDWFYPKGEGPVQRATIPSALNTPQFARRTPLLQDVLRSPGLPLDSETRDFMEPRFGHDFSQVRVHTDTTAAESARTLNALAYAVGQHVVFGQGQYSPQTKGGQRLLAHELTHTVQQSIGEVWTPSGSLHLNEAADAYKSEADAMSERVSTARSHRASKPDFHPSIPAIQRMDDPTKDLPELGDECGIANDKADAPSESLEFGNNSFSLSSQQRAQIANFVLNWQAVAANSPVRVDGYASTPGTNESNWRLSCNRAKSVVDEMTAPSSGTPGIPTTVIRTFAHGETNKFGAKANNRKVTIQSSISPPPSPKPAPAPPSASPVLKFWINAFIPNTLARAFQIPAGPFSGRQVFPGPWFIPPSHFNSCFETDERGFTSLDPASSRIQVIAEFDTGIQKLTSASGVFPGFTFEIDCSDGSSKCSETVEPRGPGVGLIPPLLFNRFDIVIDTFAKDPCVAVALDLAIRGDIGIDPVARTFDFSIFTTLFPAMEMYMSVSGGAPVSLFTMQPATSSPLTLIVPGLEPHLGSGHF